ncbi:MAG: hypothetical protein QXY75_03075 [Candidatus Bathyarchaeia archaeon]
MFFEFDRLNEFMNAIADVKCKKYYYVIELEDYAIVRAIAQSTKNTYAIEIIVDYEKLENTLNLLDVNGFIKTKTIKGWEG